MSNRICALLPLQIILLLGCFSGLVFAQNNNVTVNGTVDVQGTVGIDFDSGELQPTGTIGGNGNTFNNSSGIANGGQDGENNHNAASFLWSDPTTWYTPRYFEYHNLTVIDNLDIELRSNRTDWGTQNANYAYNYSRSSPVVIHVPIFIMRWFTEDFNYNLFGLSAEPFSNLRSLWNPRSIPSVHLGAQAGYMGDSSIEHCIDYEFKPMTIMNKDEWRPFCTGVRSLIQFVVSMMTVTACLRHVTVW